MKIANIETTDYNENEILFFIRIKGKKHFFENIYTNTVIERLFGHLKFFHTISEYPNANHHIDINKIKIDELDYADYRFFNENIKMDVASIIFRCRGLREIPFAESKDLILRVTKYWNNFFRNNQYKLVVIHIIDNYVLDIMYKVAKFHKINVVVLTDFFIKDYRRHTIYGEFNFQKTPSLEELISIKNHLQSKKKSFWLDGINIFKNLKYTLYLFLSYYARYIIRYLIGYKLCGNLSYEYRFANVLSKISIKNFFVNKYFSKIDENEIQNKYKSAIYIPLHVFPEANVDYWITSYVDSDYYSTIFEALSFFRDKNINVYIKEHPGFLFQRNIEFYKKVIKFSNIKLISPFDYNVNLLDNIENVLVWHGSSGIEAVMSNKKVIVYDKNFYSSNFLVSLENFDKSKVLSDFEKNQFLTNILSGTLSFKKND
jgi:hypothetical protein